MRKRPQPLREVTAATWGNGRLGHQHIRGLPTLALDDLARGLAADLLVGIEKRNDWSRRHAILHDDALQRVESEIRAGLHVIDAGAVNAVAFNTHGTLRQRTDIPHGIDVSHDEHGRAADAGGDISRDDVIAQAVASANALAGDAELPQIALDRICRAATPKRAVAGDYGDGLGIVQPGRNCVRFKS